MKKVIFIYIFIFIFLSGCNINYNLEIQEDSKINENATITETKEFFNNVSNIDERIQIIFSSYENLILNSNYYVVDYREGDNLGKHLSNSYLNLDDFINKSIFYKQYWPELTYFTDKNLITVQSIGNFIISTEYSYNSSYVDSATITFTLPYKVVESTANSCTVVKNNYVCKWIINENTENLTFSLTFDKGIKVKDMTDVDLPNNIVDGVQPSIPKKNTVSNILIISGLLLLIVGLIVIIILIVRYKEKKDLEKQERGN